MIILPSFSKEELRQFQQRDEVLRALAEMLERIHEPLGLKEGKERIKPDNKECVETWKKSQGGQKSQWF